jgi:hypothetical protein
MTEKQCLMETGLKSNEAHHQPMEDSDFENYKNGLSRLVMRTKFWDEKTKRKKIFNHQSSRYKKLSKRTKLEKCT